MKAFPGKSVERSGMHSTKTFNNPGMELRDFFAAQVITYSFTANLSATELADQAYEIADAMMARREK